MFEIVGLPVCGATTTGSICICEIAPAIGSLVAPTHTRSNVTGRSRTISTGLRPANRSAPENAWASVVRDPDRVCRTESPTRHLVEPHPYDVPSSRQSVGTGHATPLERR